MTFLHSWRFKGMWWCVFLFVSGFVLRWSQSHGPGNGLGGAKPTEHEGIHKAPNRLLIPANHYTSSPHLFSTCFTASTPSSVWRLWRVTVCACEKRKSVCCSENYLAWPLNLLSAHKRELCSPALPSIWISHSSEGGGFLWEREALPPDEEQSPDSPQVSLTGGDKCADLSTGTLNSTQKKASKSRRWHTC